LVAVRLAQPVVTAAALERLDRGTIVHVEPRAILTPSAHDAVRSRDLQISRGITSSPAGAPAGGSREAVQVCVVQSTAALDRVLQESGVPVTRESCPDVAAETLANGIAREETHVGVVFAQAVHRAAMLANRNEAVRAAAVGDLQAAHEARRQVRANLWCLNADGRTDFELRNILRFLLHR
ncbi:MAG: RpiB/LacA/LacB family sugar-phosphate isomerase, partial [Planctomycetaceae bacterium]